MHRLIRNLLVTLALFATVAATAGPLLIAPPPSAARGTFRAHTRRI